MTLTPGRCVHKYIESGFTEYDHLLVVARALEMMGGRQALVGGKVPQQYLSKCKAAYGTVKRRDMTPEELHAYNLDKDQSRGAAFVDAHCNMTANAYFKYITSTSKDKQKIPKCKGCILNFQRRNGGGKERIKHEHKWE